MARRHNAELHLLNVAPNLGEDPVRFAYEIGAGDESIYQEMKEKADAKMKDLIASVDTEGVAIKRVHSRGVAPGPVILEYAEKEGIDLIAMGTHGRRGVKRFVLGSVTEEVVRQAPCSVLTVRERKERPLAPPAVRRILVPVDLSGFTDPLLRAANNVAEGYRAALDLLHVVEPLPFPAPLVGAVTIHDLIPDPSDQALEQLKGLIDSLGDTSVPITPHVKDGRAAATIVDTAEAVGSDLIVIASHGLSGLEGVLLGSVTARVVRRAGCPVLVVKVEPEE